MALARRRMKDFRQTPTIRSSGEAQKKKMMMKMKKMMMKMKMMMMMMKSRAKLARLI